MSMSMGGSGSVKAEPNVTPMIDVMLVLLIIFMLVVPAISAGFQAIPPQGVNLKRSAIRCSASTPTVSIS